MHIPLSKRLKPSRLRNLPAQLYKESETVPFSETRFRHINHSILSLLDISPESFNCQQNLELLSGNLDDLSHPAIATVYAGHQFGIYTSKLGDGRVHTLGDIESIDGESFEIQIKGAGPTVYSRGNSGRVTLAEAITEYLGSIALNSLGIETSIPLSIVSSENPDENHSSQCIFSRAAPSHLRFGHLEYCHNQRDYRAVKSLADFTIEKFYPDLKQIAGDERYLQLLYAITIRTARLVAKWQAFGFVHSVMNTDNMSVIGLTLDLGVFGFMENYSPAFSPNKNDDTERYAFNQQVEVARWNCLALAEALTALLPGKRIPSTLLRVFRQAYTETYQCLMCNKLGITQPQPQDLQLINKLLNLLNKFNKDYSGFFRQFAIDHLQRQIHLYGSNTQWNYEFNIWLNKYEQRIESENTCRQQQKNIMLANNPLYILRKHLLEKAISDATTRSDFSFMNNLISVLQKPFDIHPEFSSLSWFSEQAQYSRDAPQFTWMIKTSAII